MDSHKQRMDDAIRRLAEERAKLQTTIDGAKESMVEVDRTLAELQRRKAEAAIRPPGKKPTS